WWYCYSPEREFGRVPRPNHTRWGAGNGTTEVEHLDQASSLGTRTPEVTGPQAPAAAGHVLPASRQADPSVGAAACAPLAELLETVTQIDRLQARAVEHLARLQVSAEDVEQTGVGADTWLAVAGRM